MRCPERATATVSLYFGMNVLGDLFDLFGDCEADGEAFAGPTGGPARIIQGLGQSLGKGVYLPPVVETLNGAAEVLVARGEQPARPRNNGRRLPASPAVFHANVHCPSRVQTGLAGNPGWALAWLVAGFTDVKAEL